MNSTIEPVIESAEPLSPSSDSSDSEQQFQKRPSRMNAFGVNIQKGYMPKGMRPANSSSPHEYEDEDMKNESENPSSNKRKVALSLTHPLVLVAASIGIGLLISYYGVGLLKPAVDKVVEAAEDIVDNQNDQ